MAGKTASAQFPFLRSCKNETENQIHGEVKGHIPKWLKGHLIRIGSGLLEVGPDRYNHVFDGLAMMHRFSFADGEVTYCNRFLRSDTYRKNMKANRIVVNEFATPGVPDPCKTIFQRFLSLFNMDEYTDNDLVNIILYADEPYACSETNCIWKIDPETLESVEKVKFSQYVPVNAAIAHAHQDTDGTVYNVGSSYSLCTPQYKILKFPPKDNKCDNTFSNASVLCCISSSRYFNVSYHHSFGMTENYFIFVEQPLYLCIPKMAFIHFFSSSSYADGLHWDENQPTRFHVVRRIDGKHLETVYQAKSFFVFHHINAYEEDNHLVVDMCTYDEGGIVKSLYVKALEDLFHNHSQTLNFNCLARRFVLPLSIDDEEVNENKNLVKLSKSSAKAHKLKDGLIFCSPEILTGKEPWSVELPRINYEKFNGKKYRYFYAMSQHMENVNQTCLTKTDVVDRNCISWSEEGAIPSEPVFIADPSVEFPDEDTGVILASLLYEYNENKVSLLVLNAKTMEEIGRVTFVTAASVPGTFHGVFINKD